MALLVRRPSDWSVVLQNGPRQVRYDRRNNRLSFSQDRPAGVRPHDEAVCPMCKRAWAAADAADAQPRAEGGYDSSRAGAMVHPEYFGYLAACLQEESAIEGSSEENDGTTQQRAADDRGHGDGLSRSSFNQGYAERFFVSEGLLGRGGRGEVTRVTHVIEGISLGVFALKRVSVGNSTAWLNRVLREVKSMRFTHRNLVHYNHVWLENTRLSSFGPVVPVLHILQEFCNGGDLERYVLKIMDKRDLTVEELKLRRRQSRSGARPQTGEPTASELTADVVQSFFTDILAGLSHLHSHGCIHRDLKPSNCLLDFSSSPDANGELPLFPRVLVSDFGEMTSDRELAASTGGTGTLLWTAPEILRGQAWSQSADMFSLGLILYFLTHRATLPYAAGEADFDALKAEIERFPGYRAQASKKHVLTHGIAALLARMLSPEPTERPPCGELKSLLKSMSTTSPGDAQPPSAATPSSSPQPSPRVQEIDLDPLQPLAPSSNDDKRVTLARKNEQRLVLADRPSIAHSDNGSNVPALALLSALLKTLGASRACQPQALSVVLWLLVVAAALFEMRFLHAIQARDKPTASAAFTLLMTNALFFALLRFHTALPLGGVLCMIS